MKGWIAVAGIIVLLVLGSALVLRSGNESEGASQETPTAQPLVVTPTSPSSSPSSSAASPSGVREIAVEARRFSFSPAVVRVKEGERVKLVITNTDTTHGIIIPEFNARGRESLEFTAGRKGTYTFYCATYCGTGHSGMQGTLIVE